MSASVRSHEERMCRSCDNWCAHAAGVFPMCCRCYVLPIKDSTRWCRACKHTQMRIDMEEDFVLLQFRAPFAHEE